MNAAISNFIVDACYPSTKSFLEALSSVRGPSAQSCLVHFTQDGLTLKWEHESKSLQSGIFMSHTLFTSYSVHHDTAFSLPLNTLLDTLGVFAQGDLGELILRYPGPEAELMLESTEPIVTHSGDIGGPSLASLPQPGPTASIYSRIRTAEEISFLDLGEHFQDPISYFIGYSNMIKEAIDDMEWTQGGNGKDRAPVALTLVRDPPALNFSSTKGNMMIQVDIPVDQLNSIYVCSPEVQHKYNFEHLRAIFANLAPPRGTDSKGPMSKIAIDADGKMKVTHMLKETGTIEDLGGDYSTYPSGTASLDPGGGRGATAAARMAVAQFVLLSQWEEDEQEGALGEELGL